METSRKKVLIWVSVAAGLLAVGWTGVNLYYRHNFGQGYLAIREVIRFYDNALPALRASPPYDTLNSGEQGIRFTYQAADAPELVNLRVHLNLDSIAGNGDDISKIKNILRWAHRAIPHNGFRMPEFELTSMGLYRYATEEGEGISCKHTSRLLSDCFLSIGFSSRAVTCSSMLEKDPDCHVVNAVWSPSRSKWVYVDASLGAYYTHLTGEMLRFREIRSK